MAIASTTAKQKPISRIAPRYGDYKTAIVDACPMLTEDQLAALFDTFTNVERYVPSPETPRQLSPIGSGRPFVDIVTELTVENVEGILPKCAPSYAELTIIRRQTSASRPDVLLASHFSGRPLDPGANEVWDTLTTGGSESL